MKAVDLLQPPAFPRTRRIVRLAVVMAACLFAIVTPSSANDSSGFLGTTGVVELTKTDAISMVSERLEIGLDQIRVDYVFRNVTDKPVATVLAFPMPDIDLAVAPTAANYLFPARSDNFLGFTVAVDGKPVTPSLERRAFFKGNEVTARLAAARLLEFPPWNMPEDLSKNTSIAAGTLNELRRDGLIGQVEDSANAPLWTLMTKYYWEQTFPPGADVRVHHEYSPFVGDALIAKPSEINGKSYVGRHIEIIDGKTYIGGRHYEMIDGKPVEYLDNRHKVEDRYCIDQPTRKAIARAESSVRPQDAFVALEIEYILMTGNNWRGPIGRFTLVIDKGKPENIVSLCIDSPIHKTGPTTFESTVTNFVPKRDINLLFIARSFPRNK
jgi:hypothetical protein